jgi:NADPH2:quinone reductase
MRAWLLKSLGGLDQLELTDAPEPQAGPDESVMEVELAGLNPADRYLSEGQYPARPAMPHILGRDAIGMVNGRRMLLLRSEIGVTRPGTFAERVAIPNESLVDVPAGWTIEQAAGAPLVYLTAYQALTQWGEIPRGSAVLVTGASGGVGVASIQLGAAMGLRVIGLSRSDQKQAKLRELGAVATFDPHDTQWRKRVREFLGRDRVALAIDNIGGEGFSELLDTLGEHGRVSVVGRLAGPVPSFNTASLFFRRIRIGGVAVGTYTAQESRTAWAEIVRLLDSTGARPVVDSVFEFEKLKEAFARLEAGPMGKVLLRVAASA